MDGFAVDLDKVLDDFELSEGDVPTVNVTDPKASGLQPQLSTGGDLYNNTSSQVTQLLPNYPPNSISIPSFSRPTSFPGRYDIPFQAPETIDLSEADFSPSPFHTVHHGTATVSVKGTEGAMKSDTAPSNGHTLGCTPDGTDTPLPVNPLQDRHPWERIDNGMGDYDIKGGVLAHGELSKDSLSRRLSSDRPELIQSMAEDVTSRTPFSSEVGNLQPFVQVSVVNSIHPDVIPTSVNSMVDVARPLCHEGQNDSGVSFTTSEHSDPPSMVSVLPSEQIPTQHHTNAAISPQEDPNSRQSSMSPEPGLPQQSLSKDDSSESSRQSEASTECTEPLASRESPSPVVVSESQEASIHEGPVDVTTELGRNTVSTGGERSPEVSVSLPVAREPMTRPVGFGEGSVSSPTAREPVTLPVGFGEGSVSSPTAREPVTRPVGFGEGSVSSPTAREPVTLPVGFGEGSVSSPAAREPATRPVGFGEVSVSSPTAREPATRPVGFGEGSVSSPTAREPATRPVGFGEVSVSSPTAREPVTRPVGFGEGSVSSPTAREPATRPVGFGEGSVSLPAAREPVTRPVGFSEGSVSSPAAREPVTRPVGFGEGSVSSPTAREPTTRPVGFGEGSVSSPTAREPMTRPVGFGEGSVSSPTAREPTTRPVGFGEGSVSSPTAREPTTRPVGFGEGSASSPTAREPVTRPVGFGEGSVSSPAAREPVTRPVGFGDDDKDDNMDEMDAYLAELEQQESIVKQEDPTPITQVELSSPVGAENAQTTQAGDDDLTARTSVDAEVESAKVSPPVVQAERRGSGESVEKFLAPDITSPGIVTPMEDPGFTKVPGFVPAGTMPTLVEDEGPAGEGIRGTAVEAPLSGSAAQSSKTSPAQITFESRTTGSRESGEEASSAPFVDPILQTQPMEGVGAKDDSDGPSGSGPEGAGVSEGEGQIEAAGSLLQPTAPIPQVIEQVARDQSSAMVDPQMAPGALIVCFPTRDTDQARPIEFTAPTADQLTQSHSSTGVGARPKELPQVKKSRPNSLLGLSKPDLKPAMPILGAVSQDSGFVESADMGAAMVGVNGAASTDSSTDRTTSSTGVLVENSHDLINRQLAQKMKSPHQKEQLNLEIQQQYGNMPQRLDVGEQHTAETHSRDPTTIPVVTNRAQLASGVGLNLPTTDGSTIPRPDSGFQEEAISSSSSSSLQSVQTQSPQTSSPSLSPFPSQHSTVDVTSVATKPQQLSQSAVVAAGAQAQQDASPQLQKLKRPSSLNLIPRSDFQASQDKDSQDDDSATGDDVGYASSGSSSGHLTPFSSEGELSEPPGAVASGPEMMYSPPEVGPGAFSPPMGSSNLNVVITQLGKVAPRWVPDSEACNCMQCEARFTFTKRRHHCRACGKVFCSACCNLKCKLQYMDSKEARVCSKCYQDIVRAQAYERMHSPSRSPNPNNPAEYCSTVPPLQQASASINAPPPSVMVPVGVLRKEEIPPEQDEGTGSQRNREPKQVMFSDGIRPGGDLTELDGSEQRIPQRRHGRPMKKVERASATVDGAADPAAKSPSPKSRTKRLSDSSCRNPCLIPENGLPPVILSTGIKGDFSVEDDPDPELVMPKIRSSEDPNPVAFAINKNLFVLVKIVNLDCCVNRVCWCFSTKGMCTVGQDEVVIVLECLPDEKTIPRDIFCHINSVYDEASKGNTVSHLGHTIFGQRFLESWDHCGFLYVRPTFQCVQKLLLPSPPYVFGLLLQKWETPWAKVFPIRLMLRLGAEYRYYPCPLISVRFRKPVFGEIGHTIMNLLADFRNYQYMLPQIRGVVIHMEDKKTYIRFPRNRYDEVMKVINNSNDHVMALGANFSVDADSHLVCIQNEDGNYQTQAINIQNKPRKVTGASFVVFNGALKTSSGLRAKSSIVEDGLMVQITAESMSALKTALREMRDYTIGCGTLDTVSPEEQVLLQWTQDDKNINQGVKSPIDNLSMDGIESLHIHNATDYVGDTRTIRWTEVFFIRNEDTGNSRCEPVDLSRLAETLAQACCIALTPQLDRLKEAGLTKVGLRCTIDRDRVGYEIGANGERLPDYYMNELDNELIPVIHNAGTNSQEGPVILELVFHVIE